MRDVSTWRTQSGLKTIASMQLNAILSLHKLRWRALTYVCECMCAKLDCVNVCGNESGTNFITVHQIK